MRVGSGVQTDATTLKPEVSLAASQLVAPAYGRRCVGLRPTPKIPAPSENNLWYPAYVFLCFPMFLYVFPFFSYVFLVFQCYSMFSYVSLVFLRLPGFTMFSYVIPCFSRLSFFSSVFLCFCLFSLFPSLVSCFIKFYNIL